MIRAFKNRLGRNHSVEIERLRRVELGDRSELYVRFGAVMAAGLLIGLHTESALPVFWAGYYVIALSSHLAFIATRSKIVSGQEIGFAALLFAHQQISFAWLPVLLFTDEQRELMLIGGILIAIQLLFIVRRSDTLSLYNVMQSLGLILMSSIVFYRFLPSLETPLAVFGSILALMGLNYFFWQNLRIARRIRIDFESATLSGHQAQKMAAIGKLAGGVAHDFNNNLTAIIGSLEILKMNGPTPDSGQDIDTALIAAFQAAKTVKQLLLFARVQKPTLSEIQIADLLVELRVLTRRLIPASVELKALDTDPNLKINADRSQLLTGLINLLVNGVDAMPNGGSLELSAVDARVTKKVSMLDGSFLLPGMYVNISVNDTGHGIPPELLPRVIEPFFTTKPAGRGTGLGLSMVNGMVKELGGGLFISSRPGNTTVNLFIPVFGTPT